MKIQNPIGKKGEDIATTFLQKKGYTILDRNFRKSYKEIDIIAVWNNILVCVEVKTRTSNAFGTPLEAITKRKLTSLVQSAQFYASSHPNLPKSIRIDAVSIVLNNQLEPISIEHIENISGF